MKGFLVSLIVLLPIFPLRAATNTTTVGAIASMYTYGADVTGFTGDLVVKLDNPLLNCEDGFWVSASDATASTGNKNISALLVSAFHAGSKIYIAAYSDSANLWKGSSGKVCKAHTIGLVK